MFNSNSLLIERGFPYKNCYFLRYLIVMATEVLKIIKKYQVVIATGILKSHEV